MPQYAVPPETYDQSIPQIETAINILSHEQFKGTESVIDACCGTGRLAEYLSSKLPNGCVTGLDNAENMIDFAKQHHACPNILFKVNDLTIFNESFKQSADVIVCSWAVSHIPAEEQTAFTHNLYQYLKKDGKLITFFPVMGSLLSTTIQEIAKSEAWQHYFTHFENKRMTYTTEEYNNFLKQIGFINNVVQTCTQDILFQNKEEFLCFIATAAARYLPYLTDTSLRDRFIHAVCDSYQAKVGANDQQIPYQMTLLTANAKRPAAELTQVLKQTGSPMNAEKAVKSNVHEISFTMTRLTPS